MKESDQSLIINLSMLVQKPTGIANYINGILPYFDSLKFRSLVPKQYSHHDYVKDPYLISDKLNPDCGSKGNFSRLAWTQFQLPNIYRKLKARLLFSPVPEMPLFSRCNTVIMVHDLIPIRCPRNGSALTTYFRYHLPFVCQQATHIICNSQATADDIVDFFQIPAKKITPIFLGYNKNRFRKIKGLQKHPDKPYFVYLGRHNHHKNVSRIAFAFAQFQYRQDYELWFVGPTDSRYTLSLQQQVRELGIAPQVKFLDYVSCDDLPIILNQAHALVFPSLWEGFGFPVLEAIACGTPVITSNLSSLPEVAGDAALYVNPYEIKNIVEAMNRVTEDEKLRKQLIELGLERAKKFSWQKTANETIQVIEQFL
jgi:glycosyltransferase involved in cell wall biosynthesis